MRLLASLIILATFCFSVIHTDEVSVSNCQGESCVGFTGAHHDAQEKDSSVPNHHQHCADHCPLHVAVSAVPFSFKIWTLDESPRSFTEFFYLSPTLETLTPPPLKA